MVSEKEGIMGGMYQEQQVLSSWMNEAWRLPVIPGGRTAKLRLPIGCSSLPGPKNDFLL